VYKRQDGSKGGGWGGGSAILSSQTERMICGPMNVQEPQCHDERLLVMVDSQEGAKAGALSCKLSIGPLQKKPKQREEKDLVVY
jgi:hypothetical protein